MRLFNFSRSVNRLTRNFITGENVFSNGTERALEMLGGGLMIPARKRNALGADKIIAQEYGRHTPRDTSVGARGLAAAPPRHAAGPFPTDAGVSTQGFALLGVFRLNKEAATEVGQLFRFNGWQSHVTMVPVSAAPHPAGRVMFY